MIVRYNAADESDKRGAEGRWNHLAVQDTAWETAEFIWSHFQGRAPALGTDCEDMTLIAKYLSEIKESVAMEVRKL